MKSGLVGRNNFVDRDLMNAELKVSMKSGLVGRNNVTTSAAVMTLECLNEVRPSRPEQCHGVSSK